MCVSESSSGNPMVKSDFVLPQNCAIVELGTVWFTTLCALYDVKLCSLCTHHKQLLFPESCACLGYYPASSGNSLLTVQDNPLVSYSSVKMGPIGCPKPSVRNYHSSLRNSPEAHSSHLHRSGILKFYGSCFDSRYLVSAENFHSFCFLMNVLSFRHIQRRPHRF